MTMYEKSLNVLELPAVLEMLAQEAVSEPAKKSAADLRPVSDKREIIRLLKETTAAKNMMVLKGSPSFSGVKDVSASVMRADRGGMLNTRELLDIAALLHCARMAISYASGDRDEKTEIDGLFSALRANKYLEEKITASITGEDEIADGASPELSDIRRHIRIAGEKVRTTLQKIITSTHYAKALQEPIITMRNGRYVVPVKAECKSQLPGLVHDMSSSGATMFIEPMTVVELNNEIRELMAKEKQEIDRILMALSAQAADAGDDIRLDYDVLSSLDLIFAKAKLSYKLNAGEPEISDGGVIVLKRARHPLLPQGSAVPIDVSLGEDFDTLIITGPNTGGKTVSIKTMGLLCIMAQCGLHIPADDGSSVPVFGSVLADIGDEQSIEQSLSTFSSHMTNIIGILDECSSDSFVLFDELGAGTDPVEGAALAISIIEYARSMGAKVAATTHYAELKAFAAATVGVQNASCEFDVETLRPTYRLLVGIPGKSNAFAISSRLGLSDGIIEDARRRIDGDSASFEEVLGSLEKTRQRMEREREETEKLLKKAEADAEITANKRSEAELEREKAVTVAKREARRLIEDARRSVDEVFAEIDEIRKNAAKDMDWQRVNEAKALARRRLNETEEALGESEEIAAAPPSRPVEAGDTVEILSMGTKADVISVSPDRLLTVQAGALKITVKESDVRLVDSETQKRLKKQIKKFEASRETAIRSAAARPELDIRGMMTDEAVLVLDRYIDGATMAKLNQVTIIHGKGTGALRAAVHQSLKANRQVKSFRLGRFGEGENGVTIVELK
ncbi:MAG: endonuclease MutS2 [Oscillospiraceae bacterium]|nr:endonuclease MutS2 [Oscillospiraceae bacterium]